jgi:hypothetical protein
MDQLRVLASDGSIHVFPAGTDTSVIKNTLDGYHAELAEQQSAPRPTPSPALNPNSLPMPIPRPNPPAGKCYGDVQDFLDRHLSDAQALAATAPFNVTPQELLSVSGLESRYGKSKAAANGNYFGLHTASSHDYLGQTGAYPAALNDNVLLPTFAPQTG